MPHDGDEILRAGGQLLAEGFKQLWPHRDLDDASKGTIANDGSGQVDGPHAGESTLQRLADVKLVAGMKLSLKLELLAIVQVGGARAQGREDQHAAGIDHRNLRGIAFKVLAVPLDQVLGQAQLRIKAISRFNQDGVQMPADRAGVLGKDRSLAFHPQFGLAQGRIAG